MRNFMKKVSKKINTIVAIVGETVTNCMMKMQVFKANAKMSLCNQRGDQNLGSAIQILICVIIGALLLAGLYLLFEDLILPSVTRKIQEMFDYQG